MKTKRKKGKTSNEKQQNVCWIVGFTVLQMFLCEAQLPSMSYKFCEDEGISNPSLKIRKSPRGRINVFVLRDLLLIYNVNIKLPNLAPAIAHDP